MISVAVSFPKFDIRSSLAFISPSLRLEWSRRLMCLYEVIPRSRITEFAHVSLVTPYILTLVSPDACCKVSSLLKTDSEGTR